MAVAIRRFKQLSAQWLTTVLTRSGPLTSGRIGAIKPSTRSRILSTSIKLKVSYLRGSQSQMPRRLHLELVNAAMEDESLAFRK
jgi:hypothetical protein